MAQRWARATPPLPPGGLTIDLRGALGTGKTAWVQGFARGLDVPEGSRVVSPTFTIARSYRCAVPGVTVLHHVDAYRLHDAQDLEHCGFEEMCGEGTVVCVEWGGRVHEGLAQDRIIVRLTASEPHVRTIDIETTGPMAASVVQRWRH